MSENIKLKTSKTKEGLIISCVPTKKEKLLRAIEKMSKEELKELINILDNLEEGK